MTTSYHVCIDLRGALSNFKPQQWKQCCTADDGHTMTPDEVREYFFDQLSMGRKVIPMDSSCDNFDYQKGCSGHPQTAEVSE